MTVEYAMLDKRRVQVLDRFTDRDECRACGNELLSDGSVCLACQGGGYEKTTREYAKVGLLEGEEAGTTRVVRGAALTGIGEVAEDAWGGSWIEYERSGRRRR